MSVSLVLGSLELVDKAGSPFAVETLAEGTDWGNPQPIEVAVRSLLQDGSIVVHEGDDNREVNLRVTVTAADSVSLALGEAALMAELYRRNTLTYTPADGWSPPTVFDVITSSLAHTMDDLGEVRGERTWSIRLVCKPFGRSVAAVTFTPTPTTIGTTRQQMHTVPVAGSARTEAAIQVTHASASLGDGVLLYTFPDDGSGHSPPLRQYATAGTAAAATADAALVSGARNMLDAPTVYDIPMDTLPTGRYILLARVKTNALTEPATLAVSIEARIGSTVVGPPVVGPAFVSGTAESVVVFPSTGVWQTVTLASMALPSVDLADPSAAVLRVTIVDTNTAGPDVDIDEAWPLNLSIGALTQVDCGTGAAASGGPSRCLFLEPPTLAVPRLRLLRGHASDKSDAFYPGTGIAAWGDHEFKGGEDVKILTVTPGTGAAVTSGSYFPCHHTHATL